MNFQQEYEQFMAKLFKSALDIQSDFKNLSFENQQLIAQKANAALRRYGHAITVEDLMRCFSVR